MPRVTGTAQPGHLDHVAAGHRLELEVARHLGVQQNLHQVSCAPTVSGGGRRAGGRSGLTARHDELGAQVDVVVARSAHGSRDLRATVSNDRALALLPAAARLLLFDALELLVQLLKVERGAGAETT
jgi:hypothetical protein